MDALLAPGPDGLRLTLRGPDLVTDPGLKSAVASSLFGAPYWGNQFSAESERFLINVRSSFIGPLNQATLNAVRKAVEKSLAWIVADGLAESVAVEVTLVSLARVEIEIVLRRPITSTELNYFLIWDAYGARLESA